MIAQPPVIPACPVDLTAMKKSVGGKMEVIRRLVNHIQVDFPEKLRLLRHGFETGDAGLVRATAHTLKSSLANFGAWEARELARTIEACGGAGELAAAEKLVPQLEKEIEKILCFFSSADWLEIL